MAISRRGIFGVFAGAATAVAVPQDVWTRRSGTTYIGSGMRAADPVLLDFFEVNAVPRIWTVSDSASMARLIGKKLNRRESS